MHLVAEVLPFLNAISIHSITASTGSPCPQSDNTGAVVGGVVAVVAIVTGVVIVTYLVLRYKRGGKM